MGGHPVTPWLLLLVALALIVACGYFVAAEFALVTVDRGQVDRAVGAGERGALGVQHSLANLSTQLSGAQVGITLTNLAVGFLAEPAIATIVRDPLTALGVSEGALRPVSITLGMAIGTALTMVFGELIPKNLAIARPLQVAIATSGFQRGFTYVMRGPIRVLNGSANALIRRLGVEPQEELRSARSSSELASLVARSAVHGTLDSETASLMERSVSFGSRTAGEIMTPRVRTTTVEEGDRAQSVLELAQRSGHSRFPVIGTDETVVGTVHVKHVVALPVHERTAVRVKKLMSRAVLVPDSLRLDPLLALLRGDGFQMAVVLDEYGGFAGIVTLEDVVEEIVGDIADEHDRHGARFYARRDGSWALSGLLRPDEVGGLTGVELPGHEDYDTLAGLVMQRLGRIPTTGDVLALTVLDRPEPARVRRRQVELTVERMDGLRVDRVGLRLLDPPPGPKETGPKESGHE